MMDQFKLDFVGIGTAKSGTTWIAGCLQEHSQICLSKPKELHYFTENSIRGMKGSYGLGESWLRSHFTHCRAGQLKGEYSVFYYLDPSTPTLIREHNPDIKLIIALRNPIERLQSLYYTMSMQYNLPETFEQFVAEDEHFLETGRYYSYLQHFLEVFSRENMLIIIYDDIINDPANIVYELYDFLGVDPDFIPPTLGRKVNLRREVRWVFIRDILSAMTDSLNYTPHLKWLLILQRKLKINYIRNWLLKVNTKPATIAYKPMSGETRQYLREYYAESNYALGKLLATDLSRWNE